MNIPQSRTSVIYESWPEKHAWFLLHDNRAMSIEFMLVLLHHSVYFSGQTQKYYQLLSGYYQQRPFIKLFMFLDA